MNDTNSHDHHQQLAETGWVVMEDYLSAESLAQLTARLDELISSEGGNAGSEFRHEPGATRLANLVDKGEIFEWLIARPEILDAVQSVLGNEFKLSSLNYRAALPSADEAQPLHCDTGALPDERGNSVCNVIVMLDNFTLENGPTRAIAGSHRWHRLPQDVLADPIATHPDEVYVTGRAGTVVVMNAHVWHGGTVNRTDRARRALHIFFCRRDKPQQQYQKGLLRPETQQRLNPQLRTLLALDDPLNDELCAQVTSMSGFLR